MAGVRLCHHHRGERLGAGPEPDHLRPRGAVVRTAYDTTELPAEVGDTLDVVVEDLQSGWVWCRSRHGDEGWVPVRALDLEG
jgi:variant SH3 domain-containing protein